MDNHIIPECYLDTMLVETLIFPAKAYNHQKGCHAVAKEMQEKFADSFALGIIDNDKKPVDYLAEFVKIAEYERHNMMLFKHPKKHHYLILHPPIESWLIKQAAEKNMKLPDYGLPADLKSLIKITKIATSKQDPRFKRLFRDLETGQADGIRILKGWVAHLKHHTYKTDINTLQNL
ncbi:hypothetical protein [Methylovulum psychrotolerans]|nr:hypothetical protein [Methylovulum psychrotolerans]